MIRAYIRTADIEQGWRPLKVLPRGLRPVFSSSNEGKAEGSIADAVEFGRFVAENRSGLFLFAGRARYNFVVRRNEAFCTLTIDSLGEELTELDAMVILEALADDGLAFAFAAHVDEYHHRNRYLRTVGANHFEGWVGRDLTKHIPGIYWLTVLSDEYRHILPQSPTSIAAPSRVNRLGPRHWLVKAFENMNDWAQYAPFLDAWCARQPDVFSIERIRPQLEAAENVAALSKLIAQWR